MIGLLMMAWGCKEKSPFADNDIYIYDLDQEFGQFQYRRGVTYQDQIPEQLSDRVNLIFFAKKETEQNSRDKICRFKEQAFTTIYTLAHTSGIKIKDYCED